MMKNDILELFNDIKNHKPIRVYFADEDFGVHEWNEETQRYESFLGITIEELVKIIKTPNHHIKIERVIDNE